MSYGKVLSEDVSSSGYTVRGACCGSGCDFENNNAFTSPGELEFDAGAGPLVYYEAEQCTIQHVLWVT